MSTWKPIPGWEGFYDASDDGQIRSLPRVITVRGGTHIGKGSYTQRTRGRVLKPQVMRSGHLRINLHNRLSTDHNYGRPLPALVHRLVLETFVGPCPPGMEARHLDGNPANNHLDNLRWGTRAEQRADDRRNGVTGWGERARASKLFADDVLSIRRRSGERRSALAREFNVSATTIDAIRARRTWKHLPEED